MKKREPRRRSEEVRRKLNQESQSSIHQAVRRAVDPPAVQPRGGSAFKTLPGAPDGSSAIKRRFKPGWRVLSLALVAGLSYLLLTAWQSPDYLISSVRVRGLQRITEEEVLYEADLLGKHIFTVQPDEVESALAAKFPEFREIRVGVSLPARVSISVSERQPMFAWETKNGLMWIDTEGYLIPARGTASQMLTIKADSLPVYQLEVNLKEEGLRKIIQDKSIVKPGLAELNFFAQSKHLDSSLLTGVLQLNAWMPEEPYLLYQKQRGLGWEDVRGWDVFVGAKLENINDKMVMYETIVRELEDQGIDPSMVSVEFLYAPYYRVD